MTITKVISYFISLAMISVILWAQNQTSLFDSIIPTLPWGIAVSYTHLTLPTKAQV